MASLSCARVPQRQDRVEHHTAYILKVDVDGFGCRRLQLCCEIVAFMVDAGIRPKGCHCISAFISPARSAHHMSSHQPGNLANRRPHGPGCFCHASCLAGFWHSYLDQTRPSGKARHPQHSQRPRRMHHAWVKQRHPRSTRKRVVLPAVESQHPVPRTKSLHKM